VTGWLFVSRPVRPLASAPASTATRSPATPLHDGFKQEAELGLEDVRVGDD